MTRRTARAIGALLAPSVGLLISSSRPTRGRTRAWRASVARMYRRQPPHAYHPPGELAIATRSDGSPDVHLLHARYTGSVVTRDQGTSVIRSIFTVRVVMSGPTPAQLTAVRQSLAGAAGSAVELRPLPIRRVESAIVYAGAADHGAPAETPLPPAHIESTEAAPPREGYWTERVFTLGLGPEDAQLLSTALARGSVALSIGYAFLSDGIGPDQPLQQLSGSPALVDELRKAIEPPKPAADPDAAGRDAARPVMVRAGAVGVTADVARWPGIVTRVDINESIRRADVRYDHQPVDAVA